MNLLKLKSIIYRYTGIYLAHKEENDYLTSEQFWIDHQLTVKHNDWNMGDCDAQGLLIGTWQSRNKLYRPWSGYRVYRRSLWNLVDWFVCFYITARNDLYSLFRSKQ